MSNEKMFTISRKISILLIAMLAVCIVTVSLFNYVMNRNERVMYSADKAVAIAESVAAAIDPDEFEKTMNSLEKNEHWYTVKKFVDGVYKRNHVRYLYILDNEYDTEVHYFMEGYDAAVATEDEYDLGDPEGIDVFADETFWTLENAKASASDIYVSGDYGEMVSGFAAIVNNEGKAVGVVGVDIDLEALLAETEGQALSTIILWASMILIFAVFIVLFQRLIRKIVGKPIKQLIVASNHIAKGDMDVNIDINTNDEIGALARSFEEMVNSTQTQVEVLHRLSEGDLTVDVDVRGENDMMGYAMKSMIEKLEVSFMELRDNAKNVAHRSEDISSGAKQLADSSAEQTITMEKLSGTIAEVLEKTQENADMAEQAAGLSDNIKKSAELGTEQMRQMIQAVNEIDESSRQIGHVIKTIDDIAFQTNILALNAAVEAARAGQHGKGFAVVADEVRALATKSAESASSTAGLIQASMEKTAMGVKIAGETAKSLEEITVGIEESAAVVADISASSDVQKRAIVEIRNAAEQFVSVIEENDVLSQDSAASSEQLTRLAQLLEEVSMRFKLHS